MSTHAPPVPGEDSSQTGHELMLDATLEAVGRACSQLRSLLPSGLPRQESDAIEIAIAEAMTNIVRHGFVNARGGSIRLRWEVQPQALEVHLFDRGAPIPAQRLIDAGPQAFAFDPDDVASLPESGLGLALIKAAFDLVEYTQVDGLNHLHLVKNVSGKLKS